MEPLRLTQLLESHRDRQYRRGALQLALTYGVISSAEWSALMRQYVHRRVGTLGYRRGRACFNLRSAGWSWEKDRVGEQPFCATLASKPLRDHWSSVVRAVGRGGVLAWQYHQRIVGFLAAPALLWNVLREWREGRPSRYPKIEEWLGQRLPSDPAPVGEPLQRKTWGLGTQPKSMAHLAETLRRQGGVMLLTRHRQPCAFLIALDALGALRRQGPVPSGWGEQVLSWISEISTSA